MPKDFCEAHSGMVTQIKNNEKNIDTLFTKITKIENRPPVWMSLAFSAAIGIIGWLTKGA